jgi:hypothetical protein
MHRRLGAPAALRQLPRSYTPHPFQNLNVLVAHGCASPQERRGIIARFEQQWRTGGAPFHIQPVCSVGTNDGAKGIGFLSVGQVFDCHLTLASNRDGHKDDAGSVTAAVLLLPGGFFEEVETWGDTSWTPDGVQCSKSASKNKERGASTWRPFQ